MPWLIHTESSCISARFYGSISAFMKVKEFIMKPCVGEEINLPIDNLGINGEGVGRLQGFTLFVDGALPGEQVSAVVDETRSNFGRAHTQQILYLVALSPRYKPRSIVSEPERPIENYLIGKIVARNRYAGRCK